MTDAAPLVWHPIAEWVNDTPGHIRSYADLWVVEDATGNGWREPDAWFNTRTSEWMIDDGHGTSDTMTTSGATATHFMIIEGPMD